MPMTANGLVKLIEECNELGQIGAKKLAYYHTDVHPDGMGSMKKRLENEIADVMAACEFVMTYHALSAERIGARRIEKMALFEEWHAQTDNNQDGIDLVLFGYRICEYCGKRTRVLTAGCDHCDVEDK